jgi:hypothetical protein
VHLRRPSAAVCVLHTSMTTKICAARLHALLRFQANLVILHVLETHACALLFHAHSCSQVPSIDA